MVLWGQEVDTMFLTISDAAKAKLAAKLTPTTKIVLDFDDGVGPFSDAGM